MKISKHDKQIIANLEIIEVLQTTLIEDITKKLQYTDCKEWADVLRHIKKQHHYISGINNKLETAKNKEFSEEYRFHIGDSIMKVIGSLKQFDLKEEEVKKSLLKSVHDDLGKYDYIANRDTYIVVTEWDNGEGVDVDINGKLFALTFGEIEAINHLVGELKITDKKDIRED